MDYYTIYILFFIDIDTIYMLYCLWLDRIYSPLNLKK